jgi:iron complex outermembrane receptor protein
MLTVLPSYRYLDSANDPILRKLRLIAGARYTRERKSFVNYLCNINDPVAPPSCASVPTGDLTASTSSSGRIDNAKTYHAVTWKAGLQYQIAPGSMAFFTASAGFKSGGFFPGALVLNSLGPEKLIDFELGVKSRFFDNKLQANIELSRMNYNGHQESHLAYVGSPGILVLGTFNSGDATLEGAVKCLGRTSPTCPAGIDRRSGFRQAGELRKFRSRSAESNDECI